MTTLPLSPEQLREALDGDAPGTSAEGWRLLREDVRALAPTLDPAFEHELRTRLFEQETVPGATAGANDGGRVPEPAPAPRLLAGLRARFGAGLLAGSAAAALGALALVLVAVGTLDAGRPNQIVPLAGTIAPQKHAKAPSESSRFVPEAVRGRSGEAPVSSASAAAVGTAGAAGAPARVQEQAASISLSAPPAEVQGVADAVGRLASREGGYVVNSQVNVQRERNAGGEATLVLSIPSARLTQALAALGRLAPVRAQSQSLQDITEAYEGARRQLADSVAERAALLRALAKATTQGQIESLRRRLALAGGAIDRAKASLQSVSRRASISRVEVAVLASTRAATGGLTVGRGLHDAGRVLVVALAVLLIGLAVIGPLGLLAAILTFAARRRRRVLREHALDSANP